MNLRSDSPFAWSGRGPTGERLDFVGDEQATRALTEALRSIVPRPFDHLEVARRAFHVQPLAPSDGGVVYVKDPPPNQPAKEAGRP